MSDLVKGIGHIGPTYPVKPVQPVQKDRKPGGERKNRQQPESAVDVNESDKDDDQPPTIDELV